MTYVPSGKEEAEFLQNYDPTKYQNPAVAADTALFAADGDTLRLLLIRRGGYPYKGCWALPGGFVDIGEDIIDSAKRELEEETGIQDIYLEQAFVWGRPNRDPRQRVITVSYIALADFSQLSVKAGDDADDAGWFTIENYRSYQEDGIAHITYTLRGKQTLTPHVTYPTGRIQEIARMQSGGLAFDHAESVTYSFELFKQRALHGRFLDFALNDTQQKDHVKQVLSGYKGTTD